MIAATGAAMLIALPDGAPETLRAFLAAGATHLLPVDADAAMIHASIKLAERHARRTLDVRRRRTHADGEVGKSIAGSPMSSIGTSRALPSSSRCHGST